MYPIAASFRSKISRSMISVPSTTAASIVAKSFPKHSAASLSFFATGSSSWTGTSNGQEPQRRPFWATTPLDEPKVNDSPALAAETAGVAMEDMTAAKKTAKKPKEAKAKKATKEKVPEAEVVLPESDKDAWNIDYMSRVLAVKNDLGIAKSKKIIDDIFEIIADGITKKKQVKVARFGSFETMVTKARTMKSIQTKQSYVVPAKWRTTFKVSSVLRAKIAELEVPADTPK